MKWNNFNVLRLGDISVGLSGLIPQSAIKLNIEDEKKPNNKEMKKTIIESRLQINTLKSDYEMKIKINEKNFSDLDYLISSPKAKNNSLKYFHYSVKSYYLKKYKMNYDELVKTTDDAHKFFFVINFLDTYPGFIDRLSKFKSLTNKVWEISIYKTIMYMFGSAWRTILNIPEVDDIYDQVKLDSNSVGIVTKSNNFVMKGGKIITNYGIGNALKTKWGDDKGSYANYVQNPWIGGSGWGTGGKEKIGVELKNTSKPILVTWEDIKTMLSIEGYWASRTWLKEIILIPEITVINPPVNKMKIGVGHYHLWSGKHRKSYYSFISKDLHVPKSFQESYWTFSDIVKVFSDGLGYASLLPFTGSLSTILNTINTGIKAGQYINNFINNLQSSESGVLDKNNYHTYSGRSNVIRLPIGQKLEKEENIELDLQNMFFEIERNNGYFWDQTEVSLNRFFVQFVFEERIPEIPEFY